MINCPYCGKLTDPRLNSCPHCHAPMRRNAQAGAVPPPAAMVPPAPSAPRTGGTCPTCRATVNPGDIICVKCGTNLLTGQQIINAPAPSPAAPRSGNLARFFGVILLIMLIVGGAGGGYYVLVYNEPVTKAKREAAQGNLIAAVDTLNTYTQTHKDRAEAFELLGRYQFRSQRFPEAAAALDAAAKLSPTNADLNYQAAAAAARIPGGGLNEQIAAFRRIVDNHPQDTEAAYLLAMALGAAGQFAEQMEMLQKIVDTPAPGTENAGRYLGIAKALAGDVAGGAVLVNQSADGPDRSLARGLLANLQGNAEAALPDLQAGLQGGSPAIQALAGTQLGLLLMSEGKYEDALPVLREASTAPQAPAAAGFFYALCLQNAELDAEALAEFSAIAQKGGDYALDAAAQLAQIYIQMDKPDKAEEALRQATAGGKKSAKIYTLQGTLAGRAGDLNAAQQSFRMALQMEPTYAPAHLELGLAQIAVQRLTEGVASLRKYLELAGDSREASGPEITLLVNQLEQTIQKGGDAPPPQAARTTTPESQESAS
jgi:cytochrome c-type biogenesis protein CcmH/NrfG